jgi:hypothetical protein
LPSCASKSATISRCATHRGTVSFVGKSSVKATNASKSVGQAQVGLTLSTEFSNIVGRRILLINGVNLVKNAILKFREACVKAGVSDFVLTGVLGGICFNCLNSRSWMASAITDFQGQSKLAEENGDKGTVDRLQGLVARNSAQMKQLKGVLKAAEEAYEAAEGKKYIKPSKSSAPTQSIDVQRADIDRMVKEALS